MPTLTATIGMVKHGAEFGLAPTWIAMAEEILSPRAAHLLVENPGLTLHFLASNENVNFSRWEADLAIRLRKPLPLAGAG